MREREGGMWMDGVEERKEKEGGELVENTIWEGDESVVVEEMKGMRV